MTKKYFSFVLFFCISVMFSGCKEDTAKLEEWTIKSIRKEWRVGSSINLSCKLANTEKHRYDGTLHFNYDKVSLDLPVIVTKKGTKKTLDIDVASDEVLTSLLTDFQNRIDSASKIAECTSWAQLRDCLTKDLLSQYEKLDDGLSAAYYKYINAQRSVSSMNQYNAYVNEVILPFLAKIGADSQIASNMQITNEQRVSEIDSDNKWWREQIKNARNTWVDKNPEEAKRRGIHKF